MRAREQQQQLLTELLHLRILLGILHDSNSQNPAQQNLRRQRRESPRVEHPILIIEENGQSGENEGLILIVPNAPQEQNHLQQSEMTPQQNQEFEEALRDAIFLETLRNILTREQQ